MRTVRVAGLILGLLALLGGGLRASSQGRQQQPQAAGPVDLAAGKIVFEGHCATCHGLDGSGGDGPDLRGIIPVLGAENAENIVRRGIPGTEMPSFAGAAGNEVADVLAYVATLGAISAEAIKGDPQHGQALYAQEGCASCHIISGQGGVIGPELTRVGATRGPSFLRKQLLTPGAELPHQGVVGGDRGRFTIGLMFKAVTKDGQTIEGIRMSEDTFGIVLKDVNGRFHEFATADLVSLEKEPGKSFMPSYKDALSSAELEDLVAYLAGLKGMK